MTYVDPDILKSAQAWRRDIHTHPELAFEETRTSKLVAAELEAMGMEVVTGIAKTGLVGILKRGIGKNNKGPSIGIRADMDALPIHETTNVKYASTSDGCMHACGHDGHTAMALAAARQISGMSGLNGTVYFVFQPAEENYGGAEEMIKDGLFERFPMDAIYGLHNMPKLPVGEYLVKSGTVTAAYDAFDIEVFGKGGHGAMPELAVDPIIAASALVLGLNTIVSRNIAASKPAVLTVGHIGAGDAHNVIPEVATLRGSCRSFDPQTRALIEKRMREICKGIEQSYGVTINLKYENGYPSVINSVAEAEHVANAARKVTDADKVVTEFDPFMGSEDFSYFLREKPGCYFVLGAGETGGPLHSPTYNFNDDALKYGIGLWVQLVQDILG